MVEKRTRNKEIKMLNGIIAIVRTINEAKSAEDKKAK